MRWAVIGCGRVGTALGHWLRTAPTRELGPAPRGGVLIAIPDDSLEGFAAALAPRRASWRGWCFLHTSGARTSAALASLGIKGAAIGSLHPMMTFGRGAPVPSPKGLLFTLEGDAAARRAARTLVREWGGNPLELTATRKTALHFAATLVGPGAVVAMAAAEAALRQSGLKNKDLAAARAGLGQLLQATATNLGRGTTADAWTGPVARDDRRTLDLHWQVADSSDLRGYYAGLVGTGRRLLPGHRR